jgi:hypothetical protein
MPLINPETGAVEQYIWVVFQQGLKAALQAVSDAQALINPAYKFRVETNLYRPTIEQIENQALVNILIDGYDPMNSTQSIEDHLVSFHFDCYVRGRNENDPDNPGSLIPADQVAVERLHYLCAQVGYGIKKLEDYYMGLSDNKQVNRGKLSLKFNPVDDAAESATPYAPARFTLECSFPYTSADLTLVDITQTLITLPEWASRFTYT